MSPEWWLACTADYAFLHKPVARAKVAALVVKGHRLATVGLNQAKTHPIAKRFGRNPDACFLHAEVDALYKGSRITDLRDCDLYVARTWKNGQWAMSKPCEGCRRAIKFFGVGRVFYTVGPGDYGDYHVQ